MNPKGMPVGIDACRQQLIPKLLGEAQNAISSLGELVLELAGGLKPILHQPEATAAGSQVRENAGPVPTPCFPPLGLEIHSLIQRIQVRSIVQDIRDRLEI